MQYDVQLEDLRRLVAQYKQVGDWVCIRERVLAGCGQCRRAHVPKGAAKQASRCVVVGDNR